MAAVIVGSDFHIGQSGTGFVDETTGDKRGDACDAYVVFYDFVLRKAESWYAVSHIAER